jgi:alpha-ketoglutarate-dependent taurine dioxygenase
VKGGASIFSDALRAAYMLHEHDRTAFNTLTNEPVAFHYVNDRHHLYCEHPTIELVPPGELGYRADGEPVVRHVNYSPPFQAPLPLATARNPLFLQSLKMFASLITSPMSLYEYQLIEGDAVIFDNRRVLHGRKEFEDGSEKLGDGRGASDGTRWLKGCYLEAEDILDRLNSLQTQKKHSVVEKYP